MGRSARFVLKRSPESAEITLLGSIATHGSPAVVQVSTTEKLMFVPAEDPQGTSLNQNRRRTLSVARG